MDIERLHHVLCPFPSQLLTVTITLLRDKGMLQAGMLQVKTVSVHCLQQTLQVS